MFLFDIIKSQILGASDVTNNEKIVIAVAADDNWKEGLGLGNQFMTLALAYSFAQKIHGAKLLIFHNLKCKNENEFKDVTKRCFGLHRFGVHFPLIQDLGQFLQRYNKEQIKVIEEFKELDQPSEHFEKHKIFLIKLIFKKEVTSYFDKHNFAFKNMFVYLPKLTKEAKEIITEIQNTESVAVHVRRGDFVKFGWDLPLSFHVVAAYIIFSKKPNVQYYVFSDDIKYVQNYFASIQNIQKDLSEYNLSKNQIQIFQKKLLAVNYVTEKVKHSLEEFHLMSSCKHNIIPRSTYSWWAAYLNKNPNKIVIFPKIRAHERFDENFPDSPPSEKWLKYDTHK